MAVLGGVVVPKRVLLLAASEHLDARLVKRSHSSTFIISYPVLPRKVIRYVLPLSPNIKVVRIDTELIAVTPMKNDRCGIPIYT